MTSQYAVLKRGKYFSGDWTTRVLTVDTDYGLVSLSQKDFPERTTHHRLKLNEVRLWPTYNVELIEEESNTPEAALTFVVKGFPNVKVSDEMVRVYQGEEEEWWLRCVDKDNLEEIVTTFTKCIKPKKQCVWWRVLNSRRPLTLTILGSLVEVEQQLSRSSAPPTL